MIIELGLDNWVTTYHFGIKGIKCLEKELPLI